MTEEYHHTEFVAGVTKILSEHPDTGILVILDAPDGVISLCNSPYSVVTIGLLRKATISIESLFVPKGTAEIKTGETENMANAVLGKSEGWKN